MSDLDMHRRPWFFLLCVATAFLAGSIAADPHNELDVAEGEAAPVVVATAPQPCVPDTRNWVAKGFDGVPTPPKATP